MGVYSWRGLLSEEGGGAFGVEWNYDYLVGELGFLVQLCEWNVVDVELRAMGVF